MARSRKKRETFPPPERKPQERDKYLKAAGQINGWAPAAEVLDTIASVRTVFPDFNRAVGVGGLPIRRMHTLHGPSAGGKTAFALGLVKSFVDVGYLGAYVDAEHSLGKEFAAEVVADLQSKPNFLASRPVSYEKTIDAVNEFLSHAEKVGKEYPEHKAVLVIDSINKLVPERELRNVLKDGGQEVAKGHHARYRAALNQAWLDQLTPKIARSNCALVLIAQERDGDTTDFFRGQDTFKVKGGAGLIFDASLVIRVEKARPVWLNPNVEKKNDAIAGFGHRVRIWKSKVGHMDGRHSDCIFHLSNGRITPPGLDTARDAVVVALRLGVIKQSGSWYTFAGRRHQGLTKSLEYFCKNPDRLAELFDKVSEAIDRRAA